MHGTFDELREAHPGQWLLIRLDHEESDSGTLLFANKDPEQVEEEALSQVREPKGARPLYITHSETEDDKDLVFVL